MIDITTLVAPANFKPKEWQSGAPDSLLRGAAVADSPDVARVAAIARRAPLEPGSPRAAALVEAMTARFGRANPRCRCASIVAQRGAPPRACISRLNETQAWALYEIGIHSGLLGPIGVGHGKTLLNILAPIAMRGCQVALLLVPPNLVEQLTAEYELVAQHFRVPTLIVHGAHDYRQDVAGAPVLHVLPYSLLSQHRYTTWIDTLAPDTVIADEVHKLRHADTATTSRVLRFFSSHHGARFCGWSGSITDASLKDYDHLSMLALRMSSPLPLDREVTEDWGRAIDAGNDAPAGALMRIARDGIDDGTHIREIFHRRLVETPGVIATRESAIDARLVISERVAPPMPPEIAAALDQVRGTWQRPDGEEIIDALTLARCLRELASGFFYRWTFPRGESVEAITAWREARSAWRKELRQKLFAREPHLDSALLCTRAAMRAHGEHVPMTESVHIGDDENGDPVYEERQIEDRHLPTWPARHWPAWRDLRESVQPVTEAVRVSDYLVRDALEWARANRGVIWYESRAFGLWCAELSDLPLHEGGPKAGAKINAERGDRSIIASIHSHGTGRDGLQFKFATQLIASPPSSATRWEQLLGRLFRIGQPSPIVRAEFYAHTEELAETYASAQARAGYVQSTLGSKQKLLRGSR